MKPTIGTTWYGSALDVNRLAKEALTSVIKARLSSPGLILDDEGMNAIRSVKVHTRTLLTDIFVRIIAEDKLSLFTVLNFTDYKAGVPELFSNTDIVVDGKYVAKSIPVEYQTAWLNITPILSKRDAYNSGLWVTDVPACAAAFAKGMLCMSYNDSDQWLSPQHCVFIIKSYATMIGTLLRGYYNLELDEYKLVQTVFAAYFAQLLGSADAPMRVPPLLNRCTFLGNFNDINNRLAIFDEVRDKIGTDALSIPTCCKMLAEAGPARMKTLDADKIYTPMSRTPGDSQNMLIALDYPPYWVYQILISLQGSKNPMFANMIKNSDMKREIIAFGTDLASSRLFINKVIR